MIYLSFLLKGSDTVTVHNVFAELILWSSSWYKVGMLFNLEIDVLETITLQYRQDTDAALMEVIRKWFHTHHNPSWEEVQHIFSNLIVSGIKSLLLGPFSMVIIILTHFCFYYLCIELIQVLFFFFRCVTN